MLIENLEKILDNKKSNKFKIKHKKNLINNSMKIK